MSMLRCVWAQREYEVFASKFSGKLMAAYTEAPIGENHLLGGGYHHETNQLRGITKPSSTIGLFKENTDIFFFWIDEHGNILLEAKSHLNNYGLHDNREYSLKKRQGEFRIIVLGDELTAATTASHSWPELLQDVLNSRNRGRSARTFSVINFAHLDTGFPQWAYILERRALRFNPDLILVNIAPHDFQRTFPAVTPPPNYLYLPVKEPNGTTAITVFPYVQGLPSVTNPQCQPSALLPFWVTLEAVRSPTIMREYRQETIRLAFEARKNEILSGKATFPFDSLAQAIAWQVTIPIKEVVRSLWNYNVACRRAVKSFDCVASHNPNDHRLEIEQASKYLNSIASHGIPVIGLRNPWPQDFEASPPDYDGVFKDLERVHPEIKVINMKQFMPFRSVAGQSDEIDCCYSRYAKEKWTEHGHMVYADAVANCLEGYC